MHMRAGAVAALLLATSCARPPDLDVSAATAASVDVPRVVTSRGELSKGRAEALLERNDKPGEPTLLERHLATMQQISGTPLVAGNAARLLVDGPASYAAIFRAIDAARDHVNLETYILEGDEVGSRLAALLLEKQGQGVQVNLLYDTVGSLGTSEEFFERLRQAGVQVCAFNPLLPSRGRIANPNQRDHRKQVVVDGSVVVSGGINFSSVYSSGSGIGRKKRKPNGPESGWRDTNVELRGPAATQFQRLFLDTWAEQNCPPVASRNYFPAPASAGDKVVSAIGSSSNDEPGLMYLALLSAILESRQSVHITMAYFVPDDAIVKALTDAARRGVDVKLILPGFSDSWIVFHAGRSYYGALLEGGVKIYELRGALLHAKTAVVDEVWSTVGSTNLDWRSFVHNDELNTVVLGEEFGRAMEGMFDADLRDATPIAPERWQQRPISDRVKERAGRLFAYWL